MSTATKYAYIFLVMRGSKYIPGAIIASHSLGLHTKYDRILMVTDDVKDTKIAEPFFKRIVVVDKITAKCNPLKTAKQNTIYGEWISDSFTKLRMLEFEEYSHVCFLDADLVILRSIDHVFDYKHNVATFTNMWFDRSKKSPYSHIKEGEVIPKETIMKNLATTYVGNGHLLKIKTGKKMLGYLIEILKLLEPFGNRECLSGSEEQFFAMMFSFDGWNKLENLYNIYPWHMKEYKDLLTEKDPYIIHYFNVDKPWFPESKIVEYQDRDIWWQMAQSALDLINNSSEPSVIVTPTETDVTVSLQVTDLSEHPFVKRIKESMEKIPDDCSYCIAKQTQLGVEKIPKHKMIDNGKIVCPRLT